MLEEEEERVREREKGGGGLGETEWSGERCVGGGRERAVKRGVESQTHPTDV